jgi:release factor glutamine methyltransferase
VLSISQAQSKLIKQLQSQGLSLHEAESESSVILCFILQNTKEFLSISMHQELSEAEAQLLENILLQRLKQIPLQQILGEAYFFGIKLRVNEHVLIPRPETETLVEITLKVLEKLIFKKQKSAIKILEIGTGSGCISLALSLSSKQMWPEANIQIHAIDISSDALKVAKENASQYQLDKQIIFYKADLLPESLRKESFDLLISNPPYISEAEFVGLEESVKQEPKLALVGNNNTSGLTYFERIAELKVNASCLLFELDPSRIQAIQKIFSNSFYADYEQVALPDLNKHLRFLKLTKMTQSGF